MNLVKNTSFYTLGALLPKIGAFVFLPIYLKYLSPSDYGIVSSLHVLNAVLAVLFTLSLPRSLYRIYYDYKSQHERKVLLGTVFLSVLIVSSLSLIILFVLKDQVQKIYHSISFYPYFAYAILIVFVQVFHSIPTIFLQIKEKAGIFVSLSVAYFFLKSLLILWFIIKLNRGAVGYLEGELISAIVFLPIYYGFVYKNISLKWNFSIFKNIFFFSIPLIPSFLSAWILNLSDRIFIERYFNTAEVGIYSLGYQIAGLVLVFSLAFKKAYDPYFYKIANSEDTTVAKNKLYSTNYVFIIILIFASFLISFFAREGVELFFSSQYYEAINIIPIISLSYLISQNSALLNVMMYQEKKTKVVMLITIGSAILNIILNYLLIPVIGVYGAAWATVISFLSVFIFSYFLAKKTFFIPYNWKGIIPVLLVISGIYFLFRVIDINDIIISLTIKLTLVLILSSILFYKYRTIISVLIKSKK